MKWIRNILIISISGLIVLVALEFYIKWSFAESVSHSDYDEEIGRVRRPGLKFVWNDEGMGIREYNDFGYLGPSYPKERGKNTIRIALIGDSFVEGFQVLERNHFRSVMERRLQSFYPDRKVEVLNFGRSGFNLCKLFCYYKDFATQFSPDLYVFIIANEDYVEYSTDPALPTCYLEGDSLILDYSFRTSPYLDSYNKYKFLTQDFATLQLLRNCFALVNRGKFHKILLDISYKANYQAIPQLSDSTIQYHERMTAKMFDRIDPKSTMIFHRSEEPLEFDGIREYYKRNNFAFYDIQDTINVLRNNGMKTRTMYSENLIGHWNHNSHLAIGAFLANKVHSYLEKNNLVRRQ